MKSFAIQEQHHIRVGAAVAVGAVTMLWIGAMNVAFFGFGTILLILSLIPLAKGMGMRGGAITGLLLGLVWVAARLGMVRTLNIHAVFNELNLLAVMAMVTIGALAGAMFAAKSKTPAPASPHAPTTTDTGSQCESVVATLAPMFTPAPQPIALEEVWGEVLARHRDWLMAWDQTNSPWTAFDTHVRELTRMLTGLRHLRCYRVGSDGRLYALSRDAQDENIQPTSNDLLTHVITTGQPYFAGSAACGPLIQQLATASPTSLVWAVPIRDQGVTVGLMTAGGMGDPPATDDRVRQAADLVQLLWLHIHHLDLLRAARQTDRGSGLINRTDFLPSLKATLQQCYKLHEPVVIMVVCLEGLRRLDDASQWARRDELIEKVGQAISQGLRKDDMVGRFSDAQFVALMRRLDTPLAELICRKLMSNIAKVICDFELTAWITPRAGLCGSGFVQASAEDLLARSIAALAKARTQDLLLVSESPAEKLQEATA